MKVFIILFVISINLFATLIESKDKRYKITKTKYKISDLISSYAKLDNMNLILDKDIKGVINTIGNVWLTREELKLFITRALHQSGYTIMPNGVEKSYSLVGLRDVRYGATKTFNKIENVPKDFLHYNYTFKTKYIEADEVSRNFRPFMSRYGRIIDEKYGKTLIISDTGLNIHRLYKLVKIMDKPSLLEIQKRKKEYNDKANPMLISEDSFLDVIKSEHTLFILLFTLVGIIIGFGIRGYMMKKVESGW